MNTPINLRPVYQNHRGPYTLMILRKVGEKAGGLDKIKSETINKSYSAEDAHEEARMLVNDPRDTIEGVYVFSENEQQYIGATYNRGKDYLSWEDSLRGALSALDTTPLVAPAAPVVIPKKAKPTLPAAANASKRGATYRVVKPDAPLSGGEKIQRVWNIIKSRAAFTIGDILPEVIGAFPEEKDAAHMLRSNVWRLKNIGYVVAD